VTYPEPSVAEAVTRYCVPVQVNTLEEASKPTIERFRQVWTPDLRILDAGGLELSRWQGYLPPFEFVPRLLCGLGEARLRSRDEPGAAESYDEALRRFPTALCAPEAQYFLGVARYKASHRADDLLGAWQQLRARYPQSEWRLKQIFAETPTPSASPTQPTAGPASRHE
jgi:hypothetical protein